MVAAPDGSQINLFISMDKHGKQDAREAATRRLAKAVKSITSFTAKQVYANQREGTLTLDWVPVIKVDVVSREDTRLLWDNEAVQKLSIPKKEIEDASIASRTSAANVQWSL